MLRYERKNDGLIVGYVDVEEAFSVEGIEYTSLYFELTKSGSVDAAEVFPSHDDTGKALWDAPGVKSIYEYLQEEWGIDIPKSLKDEVTQMIQNSSVESYDAESI